MLDEEHIPTAVVFSTQLDWNIYLFNEIKQSTTDARVMIFQVLSAPLRVDNSYSTAWLVVEAPSPGRVGPIKLPKSVQFGVLDKTEHDIARLAGPDSVKFGQTIDVVQLNPDDGPKIEINGNEEPGKKITATNNKGNAKSLEMALFKSDRKLVTYKNVVPNTSVSFLLESEVIYVADGTNVIEGQDFNANDEIERATKFSLANKQDLKIEITRKASGELEFSEMSQDAEESEQPQK